MLGALKHGRWLGIKEQYSFHIFAFLKKVFDGFICCNVFLGVYIIARHNINLNIGLGT